MAGSKLYDEDVTAGAPNLVCILYFSKHLIHDIANDVISIMSQNGLNISPVGCTCNPTGSSAHTRLEMFVLTIGFPVTDIEES